MAPLRLPLRPSKKPQQENNICPYPRSRPTKKSTKTPQQNGTKPAPTINTVGQPLPSKDALDARLARNLAAEARVKKEGKGKLFLRLRNAPEEGKKKLTLKLRGWNVKGEVEGEEKGEEEEEEEGDEEDSVPMSQTGLEHLSCAGEHKDKDKDEEDNEVIEAARILMGMWKDTW